MKTVIISGFPGVGKSHAFRELQGEYTILDSDSSLFSWASKGVRHPSFPNNYIKHIGENIGVVDIIMVSTHREVVDCLIKENIEFHTISPAIENKGEYLERYKMRGSDDAFITLMDKNFENFINGLNKTNLHILKKGEFLSDIIRKIKETN